VFLRTGVFTDVLLGLGLEDFYISVKGTLHASTKSNLQRNRTDDVKTVAVGATCFYVRF
jgi:hypothetical protein